MIDLPFVSWGAVTPHFLQKSALLTSELEFQGIIVAHGPSAVTWSMFEKFMHDQYGQLQSACEICAAYEELRQSDFDSVSSFIRAIRIKEHELLGTPYHLGGGAIFDFIRKLTPVVCKYVQDNAPEEWWTDVSQVYEKALNYELNRRAAVQGDPGVSRDDTVKNSAPAKSNNAFANSDKRFGNAGKRVGAPLTQSDTGGLPKEPCLE